MSGEPSLAASRFMMPLIQTTQEKNERALATVTRLLCDVHWANVHCLPGSLPVFEVRNRLGYGARWTADGKV